MNNLITSRTSARQKVQSRGRRTPLLRQTTGRRMRRPMSPPSPLLLRSGMNRSLPRPWQWKPWHCTLWRAVKRRQRRPQKRYSLGSSTTRKTRDARERLVSCAPEQVTGVATRGRIARAQGQRDRVGELVQMTSKRTLYHPPWRIPDVERRRKAPK